MNPEYVAASIVHTIPDKLIEYFVDPLKNMGIIIILIIMIANTYMFKKLWKIKTRDYMLLINLATLGIYFVMGVMSAILVSRLGPHGTLKIDDCDKMYMNVPRILFGIVAFINIVYCLVNIFTKVKKDKQYKEAVGRGYYSEETISKDENSYEKKSIDKKNVMDTISSFAEDIKEKVDIDSLKYKVNQAAESVKDLINSKNNKG